MKNQVKVFGVDNSRGSDQSFAETCHDLGEGDGASILGPRFAVHPNPKLPGGREGDSTQQNLKVFVAVIILDRNSQVGFHKAMLAKGAMKTNRARWCARTGA